MAESPIIIHNLMNNSFVQKRDEAYFRTLLRVIESTPGLYYSYETDITLRFALLTQSLLFVLYFKSSLISAHIVFHPMFEQCLQLAEKIQVD